MHVELRSFLLRLAAVMTMTVLPVIVTAFLSMPMSLGRHPGEAPPVVSAVQLRHMT